MLLKTLSVFLVFASFITAQSSTSKPYITLCCSLPATVSVLDSATLAVVNQFPSALGAAAIAPTPDFSSFYVLTQASMDGLFPGGPLGSVNSVVILHADGTLAGEVPLAAMPFAIVFDAAGTTAYVAAADESFQSHLYTIDTASQTLTGDYPLPHQSVGTDMQMILPPGSDLIFVRAFEGTAIQGISTTKHEVVRQYTCTVPYSFCSGLAVAAGPSVLTVVLNNGIKTILYLDPSTLTVRQALPTALSYPEPGNAIAVSPDRKTAYLGSLEDNYRAGDVATLDVESATVTDIQESGWIDSFAVVSPDGTYLVTNPQPERLHVRSLSGATDGRAAGTLGNIGSLFFNPAGDRVYALSLATAEVAVLDPGSGAVEAYIPSGPQPVAIASGRQRLFTANRLSQTLSVIDPKTMSVVNNLPVPFRGQYLSAAVAAGGYLFAADLENVQELNLAAGTFQLLEFPTEGCYTLFRGMAPKPNGTQLLVAFAVVYPVSGCAADPARPADAQQILQGVRVYDTATGTVLKDIGVSGAEQVVLTADGASAYVGGFTESGLHQITVIDAQSLHVARIFRIPSVKSINALALDGEGSILFVLDLTSFQIAAVDTASGSVVQSTPVDRGTSWMAGNPEGSQLYLGSETTPMIQVFDTATKSIVRTLVLKSPSLAGAFHQ